MRHSGRGSAIRVPESSSAQFLFGIGRSAAISGTGVLSAYSMINQPARYAVRRDRVKRHAVGFLRRIVRVRLLAVSPPASPGPGSPRDILSPGLIETPVQHNRSP